MFRLFVKCLVIQLSVYIPIFAFASQLDSGVSTVSSDLAWSLRAIFIGPPIETLLLAVFSRMFIHRKTIEASIIIALIFSVFHGVFMPIWGLLIFPLFVINSYAYITAKKIGGNGFLLATGLHSFHNFIAIVALNL